MQINWREEHRFESVLENCKRLCCETTDAHKPKLKNLQTPRVVPFWMYDFIKQNRPVKIKKLRLTMTNGFIKVEAMSKCQIVNDELDKSARNEISNLKALNIPLGNVRPPVETIALSSETYSLVIISNKHLESFLLCRSYFFFPHSGLMKCSFCVLKNKNT